MENMNTWRLSLYIDNSREIYSITESLSNSLAKKIKKGVKLSAESLANCSTKERKEAALKHAEYIIDCAEYKANEK